MYCHTCVLSLPVKIDWISRYVHVISKIKINYHQLINLNCKFDARMRASDNLHHDVQLVHNYKFSQTRIIKRWFNFLRNLNKWLYLYLNLNLQIRLNWTFAYIVYLGLKGSKRVPIVFWFFKFFVQRSSIGNGSDAKTFLD